MTKRILVINADDLGLCPEVDMGILETMQAGTVTVASLLVNPPFVADLRPFQAMGACLGLHLNLTLGSPIMAPREVPSLLGDDGMFETDPERLLPRIDPAEAALELAAQFERFRVLTGREPSQLSFHKHLHARNERLFCLVLELAGLSRLPVRALTPAMRDRCRENGIPTSDQFVGDVCPGGYWTVPTFEKVLGSLPDGVTELMCHPGLPMKPMKGIWYAFERNVEHRTFLSPEAKLLLKPFRLTDFSDDIWKS